MSSWRGLSRAARLVSSPAVTILGCPVGGPGVILEDDPPIVMQDDDDARAWG
jgi:hypothetical protein